MLAFSGNPRTAVYVPVCCPISDTTAMRMLLTLAMSLCIRHTYPRAKITP